MFLSHLYTSLCTHEIQCNIFLCNFHFCYAITSYKFDIRMNLPHGLLKTIDFENNLLTEKSSF